MNFENNSISDEGFEDILIGLKEHAKQIHQVNITRGKNNIQNASLLEELDSICQEKIEKAENDSQEVKLAKVFQ